MRGIIIILSRYIFLFVEYNLTVLLFEYPVNYYLNEGKDAAAALINEGRIFSIIIIYLYFILRLLLSKYKLLNKILLVFINTHLYFFYVVRNEIQISYLYFDIVFYGLFINLALYFIDDYIFKNIEKLENN